LRLAQFLHLGMLLALLGFGFAASLGRAYFLGMLLVVAALLYEHRSASRLDLMAINRAFFQSNAFVSAVFLVSVWVAL
jgi:4-hydroxybenzoate polyprenyltransferase